MKISEIDAINSEKFKKGDNDLYTCVVCEIPVSLDDSMSCQGYNLVCNRCYYRLLKVLGSNYLMDDIHKAGLARLLYNEGDTHARL